MEPASILPPAAPMAQYGYGVQASSVSQGLQNTGIALGPRPKAAQGLLFSGNAVDASRSNNYSTRDTSAPEPYKDAGQAPLDKEPAEGRTVTTSYFSDSTVGSACALPDSGELLHTIEQIRVKVNTLTSSRWNLPPATLPVFYDIDTFLGIVAVRVTGSLDSPPESRTMLWKAMEKIADHLDTTTSESSGSSPAPLPPPAAWKIPEFRGFQDDADRWIEGVNVLSYRYAWPEHYKLLVPINNIGDAAAVWHRYEGVSQHSWQERSARLFAVFGRIRLDNPVTSESDRCTTAEAAQEERYLEAVDSNCSSSAENITACPNMLIGPKLFVYIDFNTRDGTRERYANTGHFDQLACKSADYDKPSILNPIATPE